MGGVVGQVTTGGHEGHVTVGVVGQLQTGGGSHVGHVGHVSLGVVGTEEGKEVENHLLQEFVLVVVHSVKTSTSFPNQ